VRFAMWSVGGFSVGGGAGGCAPAPRGVSDGARFFFCFVVFFGKGAFVVFGAGWFFEGACVWGSGKNQSAEIWRFWCVAVGGKWGGGAVGGGFDVRRWAWVAWGLWLWGEGVVALWRSLFLIASCVGECAGVRVVVDLEGAMLWAADRVAARGLVDGFGFLALMLPSGRWGSRASGLVGSFVFVLAYCLQARRCGYGRGEREWGRCIVV